MSVQFKSVQAKEIYLLGCILRDLQYIGKESKLSETENDIRKLAIKDLKKLIKIRQKEKSA